MRDIFVTSVVAVCLPFILRQPYIGILVWSWLGYMNPHKLAWGFATTLPFAQMVAIATLIGLLINKEPRKFPKNGLVTVLFLYSFWVLVTTIDAQYSKFAWLQLEKVYKILFMTFLTLYLINSRKRVELLVAVMALSIGFYGIKGGIFTVLTGGGFRIMGPPNTFIGGNNEIGLALIMIVPLFRYFQLTSTRSSIRLGSGIAMILCTISIFGTQSRGALLGLVAMALMLIMMSRKRFVLLLGFAVMMPLILMFMPDSWHDRMESIAHYEQDASAQGRLTAWRYAYQIAVDNPLTGGGFEIFTGRTDAHSIYFEILGEHGFIGLALFLTLLVGAWISAGSIARDRSVKWRSDLMSMVRVSLVGYAVSGAFLGLAYFDLFYHLIAIVIVTKAISCETITTEADNGSGKSVVQKEGLTISNGKRFQNGQ
ncbi:putative O-glycosylation ligase, exosortase A system-associated [Aestuariirhabdus sp. Z084]|uniref:putative O-glycosylation ligase, exosortase A system-associated n=1 Tax=Aestuariirhabdus haliotis TaxID=2918751 RepID=UPI00201B3946|nr:putative O-glycosylation ligase, exosortase A system-associated [Aestuariirhabdus haliotis]MCL6414687.1 putative O-glycosylation ligase, exosortase A system-associated [Aestuariirhabdus haliotis]MCL6418619.1 putative O-glycosylation ligase, exosortase A system-associated [Aestuariirhabdus haliotis]